MDLNSIKNDLDDASPYEIWRIYCIANQFLDQQSLVDDIRNQVQVGWTATKLF